MNAINPNRYPEMIRNFVQNQFDSVLSLFGENDFHIDVWSSLTITTIFYWFVGSLYTILDLTEWPKFLYKYKVQDNTKVCKKILI